MSTAELALAQEALHQAAQPEGDRGIAPGCVLAATLRAGDTYLRCGDSIGETSDGFQIVPLRPVTVLRDAEPDLTSDPFGRELIRHWCRDENSGREFYHRFGPGGVVRVEPMPPYFVMTDGED